MTGPAGDAANGLFDPGLQPERTELAWRRTTLALVIGAAVALRILPPALGNWTLAPVFAGFGFSGLIWILAGRRARHIRHALLDHSPLPHGGALMLLLALTTTLGGALGLGYASLR